MQILQNIGARVVQWVQCFAIGNWQLDSIHNFLYRKTSNSPKPRSSNTVLTSLKYSIVNVLSSPKLML